MITLEVDLDQSPPLVGSGTRVPVAQDTAFDSPAPSASQGVIFRVRSGSLRGLRGSCDPAHHEADHRQLNKGQMGAREPLEVLGQTTAAPQPAKRALHNPALLEHHKALGGIRAFYDF